MSAASEQVAPGGELDRYRMRLRAAREAGEVSGVDEVVDDDGLRPAAAPLEDAVRDLGLTGLLAVRAESRRLVQDDGIRFGQADGASGGDRSWHAQGRQWVVDPLPVLLGAEEWEDLAAGLEQRARLLDAVQRDLYGPRRLVTDGLLPAAVVLGHPGFVPQAIDADPADRRRLVLTGADLGRDATGTWRVLADRIGTPAGAGYAMATRRITSRVMAGLHRHSDLARLRPFFHTVAGALQDLGPRGAGPAKVALLSPGTDSDTAYEHAFLSTLLGLPLVEAEDLATVAGEVRVVAADRSERVDVLLRRVDTDGVDPLDLRGDSPHGIPGLLEAARRGEVTVVNPVGAEVLDNPALAAFLPALCRAVLGEDLLLPGVPTWWGGDPAGLAHVLASLDRLVLKPLGPDAAATAVVGRLLPAERRADLAARIEAAPWAWVAQEELPLSTVPVVTPTGLEPRHFLLRGFGVTRGEEFTALPGGLGRASSGTAPYLAAEISGTVAKDVWVPAREVDRTEGLWLRDSAAATPVRHLTLAARVAENLFWVGRYAERAEGLARMLRVADDLAADHAGRVGTPGAATTSAVVDAVAAMTRLPLADPAEPWPAYLRRVVGAAETPPARGTLAYAVARLVAAAQEIRDQVSGDLWHVLARLERTVAVEVPDHELLHPLLSDLLESLLAVAGIAAESTVRDASWAYVDAGVRTERARHTLALLRSTVAVARPPATDGQVSEAALEIADSIITHRRRTAAGEGPAWPVHSAVSLLLLDAGNPRSVAWQLDRLREDVAVIGDEPLGAAVGDLAATLADVDVHAACAADRAGLHDVLDSLAERLAELGADAFRRHFARATRLRSMPSPWAPGVRQGAPRAAG